MWGCVAALTMCFVKPAPANDAGNTPATASTLTSAQVPYGVATWPEEGRGNHRALLRVDSPADAVRAHIEWRRRDQRPETKDVRVYDADTGKRVTNVVVRYLTQEAGDLAFQPATAPGNYEVYYLPYNGPKANFDDAGTYFPPKLTAEADWLKRNRLSPEAGSEAWQALSAARVVAIQARGERHRMDPMEVIATPEEITHLLGQHPRASYLVFPEDREHAIRMFETLPWRWVRSGPGTQFKGKAQPGEYYPFQLGVWAARQAITNMAVEFRDLHGSSGATIPAARLTCFNTAGTNCLGEPMHPVFAVGQGMVRALWIGIDVPVSAKGRYTGEIRLKPFGGSPTTVKVILDIDGVALADGGVSDLERLSRLKWLNSQLGMEETVIPPFTPVEAVERTVRILNREIRFNSRGLPESIVSNRREILAGPVTLVAETVAGKDALLSGKRNRTRIIKQTPATVERVTELAGDAIRCSLQSTTEFDGCILFRAILTATKPVDLKDVRLEVPVQRDVARYMMGMVKRGGLRTEKEWHWKWNIDRADNQIWLGDFDAGLQVHLRGSKDTWDLVNLRDAGLPSSWHNGGKGGCAIVETGDAVVVRAYSGPRKIDAGQTCEFVFRFLVTPFKPIDARHWNWRCGDVDGAGNIVHIHHGAPPNSYINYPFIQGRELAAAIQQIRSKPKRTSPGSLSYAAEGNLDLRRGSLHVWVTLGFDPAKGEPRHAEYNQLLFTLELPNGDGLGFYWNIDVRGLRAYVHKVSPAANPYPVMVDAPAPEWKQGESHLLTLAWDKQLAIYIDGKLRATAPYAGIAGASVEGAQLSFSGEGFLLDAIKTSDVAFSGEGAPSPAVDEHALLLDRFDRTEGKTETIPLRSHDGSHGLLAGQVAASAGPPGRRLSFASVTDPTRRNGVNLYYTVRELSDHVVEMWALRSLGNEIFTSTSTFVYSIEKTFLGQAGGGYPWLQEHLVKGYVPAWRQPLEGDVDAAIGTQGLSRWHNYYVEGLNWLMQNAGLDGLYLDGIGYDRQIMKRVARTMYHNNPDYRMNFHSGNNYEFMDHKTSPANTYMEHFPYVRDLWFGEMYNYDLPPDYWLVEISGIPFGLTSEMLNYQNGGNAYRGMVYGMGGRQHPSASAMWRLWDEFGIQEAGMIGYWDPRSPVRTGHKGVLATAYVGKGKTLIALASWAPERAECRLQLDWARLGLDPATTRWRVPQISRFQPATTLSADRAIRIEPGKGLLIWLERRESAP